MKKIDKVPDVSNLDQTEISSILSDPQQMIAIKEWNERYLHWDEIRYRVDADKALGTWAVMKLLRSNNLMSIDICGLKLKYSLLSSFLKMLHHIDMDSAGYVTMGNPGEKNVKKYVISSLMEEAIASSQLEGAATTRKDAKKMLRTQRKPSNISELMIFNNYLAMEHITKTQDRRKFKTGKTA